MTHSTPIAFLLASCALLAPMANPAHQATPAARSAAQACAGDTQRLCAGVQQGEGRITQCLQQHQSELSTGCRDAVAGIRGSLRKLSACLGDVRQLCSAIQPGGGRIVACLTQKRDQLTPGCATALDEISSLFPASQ